MYIKFIIDIIKDLASYWLLSINVWPFVGKGRGRQVIAVARTADVVIMMLDATKGDVQRCVSLLFLCAEEVWGVEVRIFFNN